MNFCGKCGYKLPEGATFCPNCGADANVKGMPVTAEEYGRYTKNIDISHSGRGASIASAIIGITAFVFLGLSLPILIISGMNALETALVFWMLCLICGILATLFGVAGFYNSINHKSGLSGMVCGIINTCVSGTAILSVLIFNNMGSLLIETIKYSLFY